MLVIFRRPKKKQKDKEHDGENVFKRLAMQVKKIIVWNPFTLPNLPENIKVSEDEFKQKEQKTQQMIDRIEHLDRELRRVGIRPVSRIWYD